MITIAQQKLCSKRTTTIRVRTVDGNTSVNFYIDYTDTDNLKIQVIHRGMFVDSEESLELEINPYETQYIPIPNSLFFPETEE